MYGSLAKERNGGTKGTVVACPTSVLYVQLELVIRKKNKMQYSAHSAALPKCQGNFGKAEGEKEESMARLAGRAGLHLTVACLLDVRQGSIGCLQPLLDCSNCCSDLQPRPESKWALCISGFSQSCPPSLGFYRRALQLQASMATRASYAQWPVGGRSGPRQICNCCKCPLPYQYTALPYSI